MAIDKQHRDSEYILRIRRTTRNMHLDFPNRTNRMMGLSIQWIRIVLHIPNTPLLQTDRERESERDRVQNVAMNECESAGDWGVELGYFFIV